jgi:cytoskeletal protein RodZ
MQLNVDPDEVRAAADRWRMTVNDLNEGGAPPVALAMTWPSAAATDAIHAEAAGATQAFAARISDTAAASHAAANLYENRETVRADEIKAVLGAVTTPAAHVAGMATGSAGAVGNAVIGAVGQLGGAAALGASSLVNALTRSLGHAGGVPQVPSDQPPHGFESGTVE